MNDRLPRALVAFGSAVLLLLAGVAALTILADQGVIRV